MSESFVGLSPTHAPTGSGDVLDPDGGWSCHLHGTWSQASDREDSR